MFESPSDLNQVESAYIPRYGPCSICDTTLPSMEDFVETIVPLYSYSNNFPIKEWNGHILQCASCLERLGKPTKRYHRPYDFDLALFVKTSDLVVLKADYPRD